MASPVTRFEVFLPFANQGTPDDTAIQNFITSMKTLSPDFFYQVYSTTAGVQFTAYFGYITTAQQPTALGYLNTLNANLSAGNTPVTCVVWNGTSEP